MQAVLLRVGIDTGSGGILGPLFKNGSFEFVPIWDQFRKIGVSKQTYGNTRGRYGGRLLLDYFPERFRKKRRDTPVHFDPEFQTFTYGDPTVLKSGLRKLKKGDLLIFYAGLEGWDFRCEPALYIIGYFEVEKAGLATAFTPAEIRKAFGRNFHVRHRAVFEDQKARLVLVKGSKKSRLLRKPRLISKLGKDKSGRPINLLSPKMQKVFGDFDGHTSIHRAPPRWVYSEFVDKAARFVRSLR